MSWEYSAALETEKDQVRFLIQDTDTNRQLFQDEEILWVIDHEANVYKAAAALCDSLVIKANRGIRSKAISGLRVTYDTTFYMTLAGQLRARGMGNEVPYAGGISVADKQRLQQDVDIVQPAIVRNLDDNPQAPGRANPPINPVTDR